MRSVAVQQLALSDCPLPQTDSSSAMRIPQGFDLRTLEVFCTVARVRNMTLAASQLQLSQSTVSQTVSQLENTLGLALFDRSVRPPALTSAGKALQLRAGKLLEQSMQALQQTRAGAGLGLSTLRIAMVDSFAAVVGPALVVALQDEAQHWRVWSGLAPAHLQALNEHEVDFIVGDHGEQSRHRSQLIVREPYLLALPLADSGPRQSLTDIAARLPLVRYSQRSRIGQQVEQYIESQGITAPLHLELDTAPAQLAMIGAGLGWGLTTPLCALQARGELHKIQLLPLPGATFHRELALLSHTGELDKLAQRSVSVARDLIHKELLPELQSRFKHLDAVLPRQS